MLPETYIADRVISTADVVRWFKPHPRLRWSLRRCIDVSLALLSIATVYAYSPPGTYFILLMEVGFTWMVVAVAWTAGLAFRAYKHRKVWAMRPRDLLAPALAITVAVLVVTDTPFETRYRLSRSSMDAAAARVMTHHAQTREIGRIGLWPTDRVDRFPGGMRFLVSGTGFLDPVGFAYSPKGTPPNIGGEDWYEHFDGPWYIWTESW